MKFTSLILAATAAVALVQPANAAQLMFDLTGSRNASFQIDSTERPDRFNDVLGIFQQATFNDVSGLFNGVAGTGTIIFGTSGFEIVAPGLGFSQFVSDAPTFRGTSVANVELLTGTFNLTSIVSGRSTLTVSPAVAAIPEPATWALMLTAFGMIGAAMRNRRRRVSVRFA